MKGVILAGGSGTRLRPLTALLNKHLFPVGTEPMIFWPIKKLKEAGINQILIVTNEKDIPQFKQLLKKGEHFDVELKYEIQSGPRGIADGLLCAKKFLNGDDKAVVLLGDNIFEDSLIQYVDEYLKMEHGALILLKEVKNASNYGVATIDENTKKIIAIEEKPLNPKSNFCVTGIYFYDEQVFEKINSLTPSSRGELEITDVINLYREKNQLAYQFLSGYWVDAGTYEDWHKANSFIFNENEDI